MTGMRSNRPLLSADIQRVVSNVLAVCPRRAVGGLRSQAGRWTVRLVQRGE